MIELEWAGKKYTISDREAFAAAAEVEEVVTLAELGAMQTNPKLTKVAAAYAALLRFCGAQVDAESVWRALSSELRPGADNPNAKRLGAIYGLFSVLMGDAPEDGGEVKDEGEKKA